MKNPLFYVSPQRLAIKNLGKHVNAKVLRKIFTEGCQEGIKRNLVDIKTLKPQFKPAVDDPPIKIVQAMIMREGKEGTKSKGYAFVEFSEHISF